MEIDIEMPEHPDPELERFMKTVSELSLEDYVKLIISINIANIPKE